MKPKTTKNPKGSGAPKQEPTEVLYIRVPKGCIIEARLSVYKIIKTHKAKSFLNWSITTEIWAHGCTKLSKCDNGYSRVAYIYVLCVWRFFSVFFFISIFLCQ